MRVPRILALQIGREIVLYSTIGFAAITVLLVSQNLLRRLDQLTMVGLTASDFGSVLLALLPMLASYATPVAFLFGLLLTLQRMSADGEWLAMQSSGLGLSAVLMPALGLGLLASLVCGWLILSVEHRARRDMVSVFKGTAARGGLIEPGRFRVVGDRIVFIESRDRSDHLEGIMIADYANPARPLRIFAERGRLDFDDDRDELRFQLKNGDVQIGDTTVRSPVDRRIAFDEFDYTIDIAALLGRAFSPVRPRQMSLPELRDVLARAADGDALFGLDERDPNEYAMEIQRRFALPVAPLLFAAAAVPLGLRLRRGGRAWGIVLCAAMVGAYYALLGLGQQAARSEWLGAAAGLWLPNVLFAAAAIALLIQMSRHGGR